MGSHRASTTSSRLSPQAPRAGAQGGLGCCQPRAGDTAVPSGRRQEGRGYRSLEDTWLLHQWQKTEPGCSQACQACSPYPSCMCPCAQTSAPPPSPQAQPGSCRHPRATARRDLACSPLEPGREALQWHCLLWGRAPRLSPDLAAGVRVREAILSPKASINAGPGSTGSVAWSLKDPGQKEAGGFALEPQQGRTLRHARPPL